MITESICVDIHCLSHMETEKLKGYKSNEAKVMFK